jgi:hypothetical protein
MYDPLNDYQAVVAVCLEDEIGPVDGIAYA